MSIAVNMSVPNDLVGEVFVAKSGNTYQSGTNGIILSVAANDVNDLQNAGCQSLAQFGGGSAGIASDGTLYAITGGATSVNPASTNADVVMAVYSIPANSFDGYGLGQRGISVSAAGIAAATGNSKRIKLYFNPSAATVGSAVSGGTLLADTGAFTSSGVGFRISGDVYKTGATGSNTQVSQATTQIYGTTSAGIGIPLFPTATESAAILVAVTGDAVTATTDINLNLFKVVGID